MMEAARLKYGTSRTRGNARRVAGAEGLELSTSGFGDRRSSQLSYAPAARTVRECAYKSAAPGCREGPAALARKSLGATQTGDGIARPAGNAGMKKGGPPARPALPASAEAGAVYFEMLATTPAPTVRPPSRMAKRRPSSMAIGAISSTSIVTLSPGITISTPSGSFTIPVTSVVRK